jgi:DNA-directed RNA polymerase subunit RPC12/RpoP
MSEPTSQASVPSCPYCGGKEFFRSRRSGLIDWFLYHVLFQNAYRCAVCDERFFRFRHFHHHRDRLHHHPV